jgi:16S rRNA processing protein RimM
MQAGRFVAKKGYVLIGEIIGTHGVKGTAKFRSYAESLAVFEPGRPVIVRERTGRETSREINWVKHHRRTPLLSLKGINDRNQAEELLGAEIFIPKAELPSPEDGSFYWFDLIGIAVYTIDGAYLGRIESIMETGSNDVYVVQDGKKEVLIPALESVVVQIDIQQKRMQVDLPEGLI